MEDCRVFAQRPLARFLESLHLHLVLIESKWLQLHYQAQIPSMSRSRYLVNVMVNVPGFVIIAELSAVLGTPVDIV